MAHFHMRVQAISRGKGQSVVAAAAYRSGERLVDNTGKVHDYSRRRHVESTELMLPDSAPGWVRGMSREAFWNKVDAFEKRKDAQTARELHIMIPRELPPPERVRVVRDFVRRNFVALGMVADIAWHNPPASDGKDNCHAHVMLTMRPLTSTGFGPKCRHDRIPDPSGKLLPNGRPVMIDSNLASWNRDAYYAACREQWEHTANAALAALGSEARIDRRSFLERGIARMAEPALRLAFHLKELHGVMRERFGQFQVARHYRTVEEAARSRYPLHQATPEAVRLSRRFHAWFDRQIERLAPDHVRAPPDYGLDR